MLDFLVVIVVDFADKYFAQLNVNFQATFKTVFLETCFRLTMFCLKAESIVDN